MEKKTVTTREKALLAIALSVGALGGTTATNLSDTDIITTEKVIEQQQEKQKAGQEFEQILKGGTKPSDAKNTVPVKGFPANTRVDVYDGPAGKGYTVIQEIVGKEIHISYGPEADERTKIINLPSVYKTASSTKPR